MPSLDDIARASKKRETESLEQQALDDMFTAELFIRLHREKENNQQLADFVDQCRKLQTQPTPEKALSLCKAVEVLRENNLASRNKPVEETITEYLKRIHNFDTALDTFETGLVWGHRIKIGKNTFARISQMLSDAKQLRQEQRTLDTRKQALRTTCTEYMTQTLEMAFTMNVHETD